MFRCGIRTDFVKFCSRFAFDEFERGVGRARTLFRGRAVWNVNSTARGGGVVELLRPLVGYARGVGVDTRWVVIDADAPFYEITKRIHNRLHGFARDRGELDDDARRKYESALADNVAAVAPQIGPNDVVILHDPQTAGMAPALRRSAAAVIWRCHVGLDSCAAARSTSAKSPATARSRRLSAA